jgi:enoyl-CoA hydratase/carnithine racemase
MQTITTRQAGPILTIKLPSSAKLSIECLQHFATIVRAANVNDGISVILVEGHPGTFCEGVDLNEFMAFGDFETLTAIIKAVFSALIECEKILVAAVDGACIGLGLTMLMHFDVVYGTPESTFSAPFVDLGLVPEAASTALAPARFGYLRAFDLLCIGREISAAAAVELGLMSEVIDACELEDRAIGVARRLARKPSGALALARRLLRGDRERMLSSMAQETDTFRAQLAEPSTRRRLALIARSVRSTGDHKLAAPSETSKVA